MERADALDRLELARVGRFASVTPEGRPHVVAVTFAVIDGHLVHMIDNKPKTTRLLQRLKNVEARPEASLLVDHYDEDWSNLWWVRAEGRVGIENEGIRWQSAREALGYKYAQYRESPPAGPAIFLSIDRLTHWSSR
jgi:PPOX class probable F420-dependent enzyme